jgi:uncharacterized RDD family membrane protein YckC
VFLPNGKVTRRACDGKLHPGCLRLPDPLLSAFFQSAMSCSICGEHCRCAEPRAYVSRSVTLAEVDAYDPSEEQFASSVMTGVASQDDEQILASGTLASARERYSSIHASEPQSGLPLPTFPMEYPVSQKQVVYDEWRNEVTSRLQNYKARRRGQGDEQSMSFNFESTAGNHVFLQPEPDPMATAYSEPEPAPNYYAAHAYATEPVFEESPTHSMDQPTSEAQSSFVDFPEVEASPAPAQETAKLIFFPKPPMPQEMRTDELADPVFETPRILDAPEEVQDEAVAIPLADITLHPEQEEDHCVPYIEPLTELPVSVAPVAQRVFAEMLDTLLVLLATSMFALIVAKLNPAFLTQEKHALLGMLVLVPAIFWAIYKYMFLVHGGLTLGMKMAQLRLVYFDGNTPAVAPRRYRALSMLVSIFPMGLGLLWSFVDPDTLCWHDRISRTYMTAQ